MPAISAAVVPAMATSSCTPPVNSTPSRRPPRKAIEPRPTTRVTSEMIKPILRRPMKSKLVSLISVSMGPIRGRGPLDAQFLQAATAREEVEDETRDEKSREHGGGDADAERHREALHRSGAEVEQHDAGEERG